MSFVSWTSSLAEAVMTSPGKSLYGSSYAGYVVKRDETLRSDGRSRAARALRAGLPTVLGLATQTCVGSTGRLYGET